MKPRECCVPFPSGRKSLERLGFTRCPGLPGLPALPGAGLPRVDSERDGIFGAFGSSGMVLAPGPKAGL